MSSRSHPSAGRRRRLTRRPSRALAGVALATAVAAASPPAARAQTTRVLAACTQGPLRDCAEFRLTASLGLGAGGTTLFEIAVRNTGAQSSATLPTSVYNVVFGTGLAAAPPGTETDVSVTPVALGGAVLANASTWDLFDSGDAVFLSALTNDGVGGCVVGTPVGGFGQAGNTCGAGQYLAFRYSTTRAFDPAAFTLLNFEVVGLAAGLPADSYNATVVPEPGPLALLAPGLLGVVALGRGRARRGEG